MENKFSTLCIHEGQEPDPHTAAVIPPISLSTSFAQESAGKHKGYEYSRAGNPNREFFEKAMAKIENAKYGLAFCSGSAATASIVNLLDSGAHIISVNDVYGGTYRYFTKVANTKNIKVDFVELVNPNNIKNILKSNTKLVWVESVTNPTLKLCDIKAVSEIIKAYSEDILLVVDNTFLSPYFFKPINFGADVVVHSVTKYINGHSDVIMGCVLTNNENFYNQLKFMQNAFGAIPSPFDCFLAHRGLKTLALRMKQHEIGALKVAKFLESSDKIKKVIYPGLSSHPQHELAKRQQSGFGGMISFEIKGDLSTSNKFFENLNLFTLAESLGSIESLCCLPSRMTHASVDLEDRIKLGISDTLIRISIGIEDEEDLIQDLKRALESV